MKILIGEFLIVLAQIAHYIPSQSIRNMIADFLENAFDGLKLDQDSTKGK